MEPVILARDVRKVYWPNVALDGVSLTLEEPGVHLILGPNGSGKSTLISILAGAERPSSGYVRVLGFDPWRDSGKLAGRVKALLDRVNLPPWLPCRDLVEATVEYSRSSWGDVLEVAGKLGVTGYWSRPYGTYSTGMKRKCLLLVALTGEAEVLMLDEPFQGLDRVAVSTVVDIVEYKARRGVTVVIATHVIPERLLEVTKTVTRMELGKVVEHTKQPGAGTHKLQLSQPPPKP